MPQKWFRIMRSDHLPGQGYVRQVLAVGVIFRVWRERIAALSGRRKPARGAALAGRFG